MLLKTDPYVHQYPHCWRCDSPIVFRATKQWFVDLKPFAEAALDAVDRTTWVPPWGWQRIRGMIADRPDWCISRQRAWGIPIPVALLRRMRNRPARPGSHRPRAGNRARAAAPMRGITTPIAQLVPEGATCAPLRQRPLPPRARHLRRLVRVRLQPPGGAEDPAGTALARRPLSGRARPVPRLVPALPLDRRHHPGPRPLRQRAHHRLRARRRRPQDVEEARQRHRSARRGKRLRRGNPPPLGFLRGFQGRHADRSRHLRAGRRWLSPSAQHHALHDGQPLRLRTPTPTCCPRRRCWRWIAGS